MPTSRRVSVLGRVDGSSSSSLELRAVRRMRSVILAMNERSVMLLYEISRWVMDESPVPRNDRSVI